MKPNIAVTISLATLLFLAVSFFIRDNKRTNRIKRDATIQAAKTDFLKLFNDKNAFIDSTLFRDDTLLFYNNGNYLGMAAIVNDTMLYYGNDAYLGMKFTVTQ